MDDHTYHGTPVSQMPLDKIHSCLEDGVCYTGGDPTVPISSEDWFWVKMRLEIELVRRSLELPIRVHE